MTTAMIDRLVVNGDSYMQVYANGNGHVDLAEKLNISRAASLAMGGSANSRIIRTTLKDSYIHNNQPTLYVLGIAFLSRWELPIVEAQSDSFEGRWTNPQNQDLRHRWQHNWSERDTDKLVDLRLQSDIYSCVDRIEDLMFQLMAMIDCLHKRGHRVLCFQQSDKVFEEFVDKLPINLFASTPVFVDQLKWRAVAWQHSQGVLPNTYIDTRYEVPDDMRHPAAGHHHILNQRLVDYIRQHNILQ